MYNYAYASFDVPNHSYSHGHQPLVYPYMNAATQISQFSPPYYQSTSNQYMCQPPLHQCPIPYQESEPIYHEHSMVEEIFMSFMESTNAQLEEMSKMIKMLSFIRSTNTQMEEMSEMIAGLWAERQRLIDEQNEDEDDNDADANDEEEVEDEMKHPHVIWDASEDEDWKDLLTRVEIPAILIEPEITDQAPPEVDHM